MKDRRAFMLQVAREVLTGRISVQEAMQRSQVKDKRTIVSWLKRAMKEHPAEQELDLMLDTDCCASDISSISTEEKITKLESELAGAKQRNLELLHFQKILTNKINDLEVLIHYAEETYQIDILPRKQKKAK
ncbi:MULTISPECIES: hypothetical protein [unclassified Sphingobacterium]|uniref:hypothetical protein n=1 Tax=unclassified Sphingobacterium TaxID=2609468 RepID=UPI0025F4CB4A|nr:MULTISPECIES: hypothetical protein [unclassified Sphingobacterium]